MNKIIADNECNTGNSVFDNIIYDYAKSLKPYMKLKGFKTEFDDGDIQYKFTNRKDEECYIQVSIWEGEEIRKVVEDSIRIYIHIGWGNYYVEVFKYHLALNPEIDAEVILEKVKEIYDKCIVKSNVESSVITADILENNANAHFVVQFKDSDSEHDIYMSESSNCEFAWAGIGQEANTVETLKKFISALYDEPIEVYADGEGLRQSSQYKFLFFEQSTHGSMYEPSEGGGEWVLTVDDIDALLTETEWKAVMATFDEANLRVDMFTQKEWEIYQVDEKLRDKKEQLRWLIENDIEELWYDRAGTEDENKKIEITEKIMKLEHQVLDLKEEIKELENKLKQIKSTKGGLAMEIKAEEQKEAKYYLNCYESSGRKLYYEVVTMTEAQAIKKLHTLMLKYVEEIETVYGTIINEAEAKVYDELASKKLGTASNIDVENPEAPVAEAPVTPETPVEAPAPAIAPETPPSPIPLPTEVK